MRAVVKCIPGILAMAIPLILSFVLSGKLGKKIKHAKDSKRMKNSAVIVLSLILAIVSALINLAIIYLIPSNADITPKQLYKQDTAFVEQTDQLGLFTMVRLDIKHLIFPASVSSEFVGPGEITEQGPAEEDEINYGYNTMNFDFDAMLSGSSNKDIQWLTKYVASGSPSKKNAYTGSMKDYNVIFVTVEGLSGYAVSEKYTPTLWKLSHEGFVFNNFYTALHFTSTSNGECQNLLGLYPKNGFPITMSETGERKTNCYFSLAQQLGRSGYKNYGFHNNQYNLYNRENSHKNLGYEYYGGHMKDGHFMLEYVNGNSPWPQKDSYMIDATMPMYVNLDQPFNVYYITISGHTPYGWNFATQDYKEALENTGWSEATKGYVAAAMEADKAIEHIVDNLKNAGKLDKTLIVVVPDHIPYGSVEIIEELSGKEFGSSEALSAINESAIDFDVYKSCLIMWSGSMKEPVYVNKPCCQVDILPTVSNLLGIEYDSRMLSGSDLLSDSDGLVVFSSKCWKSSKGFYNRFTQVFTPLKGEFQSQQEIDDYVAAMKTIVANKLDCTARIVNNNFYDYAVKYLK